MSRNFCLFSTLRTITAANTMNWHDCTSLTKIAQRLLCMAFPKFQAGRAHAALRLGC